jgi:hypothetical protein
MHEPLNKLLEQLLWDLPTLKIKDSRNFSLVADYISSIKLLEQITAQNLVSRGNFFFFLLGSGLCQSMSRLSLLSTDQRPQKLTSRQIEAVGAALIDPSRGTPTYTIEQRLAVFCCCFSFCLVGVIP